MLNAIEARKLTEQNIVSKTTINQLMLDRILIDIEKDAKNGGNFIFVDVNQINEFCVSELVKLGYKTLYKRAFTVLDRNTYKISW